MKKFIQFLSKTKFKKNLISPAFFASSTGAILLFFLLNHHVSSFNRIVSIASASDYDVSKLIINLLFSVVFFFILFVIFYLILYRFYTKHSNNSEQKDFWRFFNHYSIIASISFIIILASALFNRETNGLKSLITPTLIVMVIYFFALSAYILLNLSKKIKFNLYQKLILTLLVLGLAICVAIPRLLNYIGVIQSIIILVSIFAIKLFKFKPDFLNSAISGFAFTFSIFPISLSIFIETLNIFNQHEIFISNPLLIYRILFVIFIIISIIFSFIIHKKSLAFPNWKKFIYPALVIGIFMLNIQLPLIDTYGAHIFESANYSVLISDFFNFGKIPIVEHYGGHMLTQFFGGIFYGLLNNDFAGAIYSPYTIYITVITNTILYFLISKIVNRDIAFFSVILLPFLTANFEYFSLGLIIVFSLIRYFKKPTYRLAFLVDFCILVCTLYRLDLGVAFGIAAVVSSIIFAIVKKVSIKKLIIMSVIFAISAGAIWFIICAVKNLDAFNQLKQFIAISASNQNWAYPTLGESSKFVFPWAYLVIPFIILSTLVYLIFTKAGRKIPTQTWLILLMLGIAYFANFSRSVVRHNITGLPNSSPVLFWTSYIYLAIFISAISKNPLYFIPSYITFTVFNFLLIGASFSSINLHPSLDKIPEHLTITTTDHKVNRINIDPTIESELSKMKTFLNPFLNEGDVFFDFTNRSLIYSYMGKVDPIYATQTPGHLNGDFSQEAAIEDLKNANIKAVLVPSEHDTCLQIVLDGIHNSIRHYKLSEYIYQNYTPVIDFKIGEVWIANDHYDEALKTAQGFCSEHSECTILHKNIKPAETYKLGHIPLLWGEKDTKNASSNEKITDAKLENGYYVFDNNFDKSTGNYAMLVIDSENSRDEEIVLGNLTNSGFKETAKYIFTIKPGKHTYLFRVSHDEDWYSDNVNAIKTPVNTDITILKGD